jgi:hypothetical protein
MSSSKKGKQTGAIKKKAAPPAGDATAHEEEVATASAATPNPTPQQEQKSGQQRKRKLEEADSQKTEDVRDKKKVARGVTKQDGGDKSEVTAAAVVVIEPLARTEDQHKGSAAQMDRSDSTACTDARDSVFARCVVVVLNDIENSRILMVKMKDGTITPRHMALLNRSSGGIVVGKQVKVSKDEGGWGDHDDGEDVDLEGDNKESWEDTETDVIQFEEDELTMHDPLFSTLHSLLTSKKLSKKSRGCKWEVIDAASKRIMRIGEVCTDIFYIAMKVNWNSPNDLGEKTSGIQT